MEKNQIEHYRELWLMAIEEVIYQAKRTKELEAENQKLTIEINAILTGKQLAENSQ